MHIKYSHGDKTILIIDRVNTCLDHYAEKIDHFNIRTRSDIIHNDPKSLAYICKILGIPFIQVAKNMKIRSILAELDDEKTIKTPCFVNMFVPKKYKWIGGSCGIWESDRLIQSEESHELTCLPIISIRMIS